MESELWLPVVGYETIYHISNYGRLKAIIKRRYHEPGMRKAHADKLGYLIYPVKVNGTKKNLKAHRLVAQAFLLNPDNKRTVNHKDGNKKNNHVNNLEWATHQENNLHALNKGLRTETGSRNPQSKLTEIQVINIRHCKGEVPSKILAQLYKVNIRTINRILARQGWRHI